MGQISRRQLLFTGAAAGSGFLIGLHLEALPRVLAATAERTATDFAPNAFIRIDKDGRVTLIMNQVEMGQGTYTSMPMLIAEELEVGLDQVHLEHAPPNDELYANPIFGDQEIVMHPRFKSSHVSFISHPAEVVRLIEQAARAAGK